MWNNTYVSYDCFVRFGVERLIVARTNLQGRKTDLVLVGKNEFAVNNLIAIASNDKCAVLLAITRQLRHRLEFARIGQECFLSFMPRHKLLVDYLSLTLSRGCGRHTPIQLSACKSDGLIQFDTVEPRLFSKNFLTLDVDSLISQFASN